MNPPQHNSFNGFFDVFREPVFFRKDQVLDGIPDNSKIDCADARKRIDRDRCASLCSAYPDVVVYFCGLPKLVRHIIGFSLENPFLCPVVDILLSSTGHKKSNYRYFASLFIRRQSLRYVISHYTNTLPVLQQAGAIDPLPYRIAPHLPT